jgi:hypothetical protein
MESASIGKVEQLEVHVIGTKIFRGPSNANPLADQFQPISRVDPRLDDEVVDSALSLAIMNILTFQLGGTIAKVPEGL